MKPTEDGDSDRKMQNSQFYERDSQVGLCMGCTVFLLKNSVVQIM